MTRPDDPFRDYHRVRSWGAVRRFVVVTCLVIGVVGGWGTLASFAPTTTAAGSNLVAIPSPSATVVPAAAEPPPAVELPAPVADTSASVPQALAQSGSAAWAIHIDTTGYQAEINQCLWVRMDLGTPAPIVGAHNFCGGGQVLHMSIGDRVTLTGTGLDGTYVVSDSRDAHSGDNAFTATAGMLAVVILQTCYWSDDGAERLVGLEPAPAA
jgi:hypothetical protein